MLFGISLAIAPGEMVTLMGRNGMGKTTTVRSIMGLTPATRRLDPLRRRRRSAALPSYRVAKLGIGLVPEGRQVFPNLTVRENLVATAANRSGAAEPGRSTRSARCFRGSPSALGSMGEPALRRRAADAGDRPRADDQSAAAHPRRGDRGPGAADPRRDLALPRAAQGAPASRSWSSTRTSRR